MHRKAAPKDESAYLQALLDSVYFKVVSTLEFLLTLTLLLDYYIIPTSNQTLIWSLVLMLTVRFLCSLLFGGHTLTAPLLLHLFWQHLFAYLSNFNLLIFLIIFNLFRVYLPEGPQHSVHLPTFLYTYAALITLFFATTLGTLDDDCLLLIFSILSLPQLLTLRRVSRRFAYLIERYTLPQWRTLLYGYSEAERTQRGIPRGSSKPQVVDLFFSRSVHPYIDFCRNFNAFGPLHEPFYRRPRQLHRTVLSSLPASLPRLLSNLSCLTFTRFLGDDSALTGHHLVVNGLLSGYLSSSSWSGTLRSLHLYLEVSFFTNSTDAPLPCQLSQLPALTHLALQLSACKRASQRGLALQPESLSVLGQLTSFALHYYPGSNAPLLLRQLGPNLVSLTLCDVQCSVADFAAFLRAKPTYKRTLRSLEVDLQWNGPQELELIVACSCLHSLERLNINAYSRGALRPRLFNLRRLAALRELSTLRMGLHELRAMRDNYPREDLPRLPSIRTLGCQIGNWLDPVVGDFTPEELFTTILPLLSRIFSRLEHLTITCERRLYGNSSGPTLEELAVKAKASFPNLLSCQGVPYPEV